MNEKCNGTIHKVKEGETLYLISKQYNVKLSEIMGANPYVNVYDLRIGDEICIPGISFDS